MTVESIDLSQSTCYAGSLEISCCAEKLKTSNFIPCSRLPASCHLPLCSHARPGCRRRFQQKMSVVNIGNDVVHRKRFAQSMRCGEAGCRKSSEDIFNCICGESGGPFRKFQQAAVQFHKRARQGRRRRPWWVASEVKGQQRIERRAAAPVYDAVSVQGLVAVLAWS